MDIFGERKPKSAVKIAAESHSTRIARLSCHVGRIAMFSVIYGYSSVTDGYCDAGALSHDLDRVMLKPVQA